MYSEPAGVHFASLVVYAYWVQRYCTTNEQTSLVWGIELQVL